MWLALLESAWHVRYQIMVQFLHEHPLVTFKLIKTISPYTSHVILATPSGDAVAI